MEHRRRTISNVFDNEINDNETQTPKMNRISISIDDILDDTLDEYAKYTYNGIFSIYNVVCYRFLKLICPCCSRKR
jgi:hypothetical protein